MVDLSFLKELFRDYEVEKLHINDPFLLNSLIYCTILFAVLVTLKRKPSILLDFSQTEQLKGLAILLVIVEHFWYHVCNEKGTVLVLGDYAVTLFLLLSGYGLMRSNMDRRVTVNEFFLKRIEKIFIPYWLVTVGIIIVDYILLQKQYPFDQLILTFLGVNISKSLQYFDHARWFISLLLINYLVFFFSAKLCNPFYATLILLFFSIALIVLRRYEFFPLGARAQLLAFSLGCLLALTGFVNWWNEADMRIRVGVIMLIVSVIILTYLMVFIGKNTVNICLGKALIYVHSYMLPYMFCFLSILSISLLASSGYSSNFLIVFGYFSYELYLIHCAILIKHNPIFGHFENGYVLVGIVLWFVLALGFAYTLKLSTSLIIHTRASAKLQ